MAQLDSGSGGDTGGDDRELEDDRSSADDTTARPDSGSGGTGAASGPSAGGGTGQQTGPGPDDGPRTSSGAPPADEPTAPDDSTRELGPGPDGDSGPRTSSGDRLDPDLRSGDDIPPWRRPDTPDDTGPEPAPEAGSGLGADELDRSTIRDVERELEREIGRDLDFGQDFVIERTESGFAGRPTESLLRDLAGEQLEQQLEEATGMDVEPGREFEVVRTDEGFEARLSGPFAAMLSREAAREAGVDLGERADRAEAAARGGDGPAVESGGLSLAVSDLQEAQREQFRAAQGPGTQGLDVEAVEEFADTGPGETVTPGSRFTGTGFAGGLSPQQREQVARRVAAETGLTPGEDFTIGDFGTVQMTASGRIEMAGRPETGQTWLDERIEDFEAETGVDLASGEGDAIQGVEAWLSREAQVHREGRGWLASPDQAAEVFGGGRFRGGIARTGGVISNVFGVALGAGRLGESAGEFAFNTALAAPGTGSATREYEALTGEELPEDLDQLASEAEEFETRRSAQVGTAAATAAFLGSETVESFRERPFETLGSAYGELGAAVLAAEASPLRFSRARVPLETGETATLRTARFQTPRALERAGVTPRGRTVAGLRTGGRVRPSLGAPGIDLRRVDFDEWDRGRTAAMEPVSVLETESLFQRGTQRLARTESSGRRALERARAAEGIIDIGAEGRRGSLLDPTTEGVVRNVQAVPRDKVPEVARALEDLDATVKGSAAVRAQMREAREPRDLDIVVDDEAAARARLNEALEGAGAEADDIFDFARRDEFAAEGDLLKFGRRAPSRLQTEGGVRVTSLSEELIRKAGAAGFIRGAGVPEAQFVGRTGVVDIGPEPVGSGLPRYKDPADASTIARGLVAENLEGGFLTRRQARQQAAAIREFEDLFGEELMRPSAIQRGPSLESAAPATSDLVSDIRTTLARFGGDDRGQVTFGLPARRGGGLMASAARRADDLTDLTADVGRRADRSPSGAVRRVSEPSPSPVLLPSSGTGGSASGAVPPGEPTVASPGGGLDSAGFGGFTFDSGGPATGDDFGSPTFDSTLPPIGSPPSPPADGPPSPPTTGPPTTPTGGPSPPTDGPPTTPTPPPPTRPPDRQDDDSMLPWETDEPLGPSAVDEEPTPFGTGWFNEFVTAYALGAGPRDAPTQAQLAEAGGDLSEQLPTLAMLEGTETEREAIAEAGELFFASDEGEDELLL